MTSGFCLMLPMRTSRQPWPMSWAVATGTPGTSRPGPCGTGRPPPLGEPRQRHWHLACGTDTTAMTPGPRPSYPMGIGRVCRANPIWAWGIRACRARPVTNSSGIRGSSSCRTDVAHRAVGPWQAVLLLAILLRRPNREASNHLSNYDHGQWRTPGDADGGWCRAGQQGRKSLPAPRESAVDRNDPGRYRSPPRSLTTDSQSGKTAPDKGPIRACSPRRYGPRRRPPGCAAPCRA